MAIEIIKIICITICVLAAIFGAVVVATFPRDKEEDDEK